MPAALAHAKEYLLAAPASVALSKRLLWESVGLTAPETMRKEGPLFAWVGRQADAREGVLHFLEKRPPRWQVSVSKDLPS